MKTVMRSKNMPTHSTRAALTALALVILPLVSACGAGTAKSGVYQSAASTSSTPGSQNPDTSLPPVTGSPSPGATSTPAPFVPATTESFTVTGQGGATPSYTSIPVQTDNMLKIKIKADFGTAIGNVPGMTNGYSNYTASYGCVSYKVTVLGQTVTTALLSPYPGGTSLCPNAPSEQIIDFSGRLSPGSTTATVVVQASKYDIYCQYWWSGMIDPYRSNPYLYYNYCPQYPVYQTHKVSGTLEIQVNGSSF